MPELHLSVFIIAFGTNGDENKVIALADNVVDGPFEGFNAAGREIHRDADSPLTVHAFCGLGFSVRLSFVEGRKNGMNVGKLGFLFYSERNFEEGSGI